LTTGGAGTIPAFEALPSGGSFSGPGSSTDNAVVRFNGTGGATGQNSGLIVDDSNNVTGAANVTLSGELDAATGDFSGDVDVDGTLETDALTIGGTTLLANDTNNRVTTATGSGTLNGEANLTFDGSTLAVTGDTTISADLMIGLTSISTVGGVATYKSEIASSAGAQMLISEWGNDNVAGSLSFSKSRSASMAADRLTVNGGDDIGKVTFYADDGGGIENKVVEILAEMDQASGAGDLPGRLTFWTATDGSTTLVERMRIDSAGHTTITGELTVGVDDAGHDVKFFGDTASHYWEWDTSLNKIDAYMASGPIFSMSGGNESLNIRATDDTNVVGPTVLFDNASPDNNLHWFLRCVDSTTPRCYIYADGDLANHDGTYGTISDVKLKQDITDVRSYWDDFKSLQYRKFRHKTDVELDADAPYRLGLIAQEVETIFPALVPESPDGDIETQGDPIVDESGEPVLDDGGNPTYEKISIPIGTTHKWVKSSIIEGPIMGSVVQELMARVEALESA
jgi:hypothetical protein